MTTKPKELTPRQWALLDAAMQLLHHRALIRAKLPRLAVGDVSLEEIGTLSNAINTRAAIAIYASQDIMTLSLAIDESGLSVRQFTTDALESRNFRRVHRMLDGAEDIPASYLVRCQQILDSGYTAPRRRVAVVR